MKLSTTTLKIVRTRSKDLCELCGVRGVLHNHHRRPRAMGGSVDPLSDSPANILRIHFRCHEMVEAARQWSVNNGYIVHQGGDPSRVPVKLSDGWYLLGHRGEAVPVQAPGTVGEVHSP